jgi:hypothetical protein
MWKIPTALLIIVIVFLGINAANRWYNQRLFEKLVNGFEQESIPGILEIYSIQEGKVLTLNDSGSGAIKIVLLDIQGKGVITWKEEDFAAVVDFWAVNPETNDVLIPRERIQLSVGDQLDFSGYHFVLREIEFVSQAWFRSSQVIFLEVSLTDAF